MSALQKKRNRPAAEPGGSKKGKGCWLDTLIPHEACPLQANCHACPYCRPVRAPRLMKIVCSFTGLVLWKEVRQ